MNNLMERRSFLRQSSLSALSLAGAPLLRTSKIASKNLVLIGSGWWGGNILREAVKAGNVKVVGICDVDQAALQKTSEELKGWTGESPKWFVDYRECLEQTNPDIAIVATPDHWHALPTIAAIKQGAHVYIEKPIGHTIDEGKAILRAAREHRRVVQVGTHRRVSPHNTSAMEFLRAGKVGKVSAVKCFVNYGQGPGQITEDSDAPEELDWNMYVGPAPKRPYNSRIHPRGFRQFLDFANGTIGDWGIHWFDQVLWWTEERFPTNVFSTGGRFVKADNTDAPDTQQAIFDFEEFTLTWEHKLCAPNSNETANVGCYFYGHTGTLHIGWQDGWTFYPSKKSGETIHVEPELHDPDKQNIRELWADFIMSIEQNKRPVCDIEHGYLATNLSLLAMISYQTGRNVRWDGEKIIGDQEATAMMQRSYRAPWVYPT
ncbi:MAG: Gfo/Idh/MocA family oxidoreductase [Saprospiraceae bacterium]|nr:Gfo/Idh/MocA family oxidoreductase [Saprospiraceae bacterium]